MRLALYFFFAISAVVLCAQSVQQLEASARAHLAARDTTAALADYQKLAQLVPNSAAYQDKIGFILAATNRAADAIPHFQRATELDPKLAEAWFHLGAARLILQQPSGIGDLEKAVALDPGNADYHFRLGTADNQAGHYAEAVRQLRLASKKMSEIGRASCRERV